MNRTKDQILLERLYNIQRTLSAGDIRSVYFDTVIEAVEKRIIEGSLCII